MPVFNPPNPTVPTDPRPPTNTPAAPPKHHKPPINRPTVRPVSPPAPSPQVKPVDPITTVIAIDVALRRGCHPGASEEAGPRRYPREETKKRRQRPCSGGSPQIEYEEKRRKIGRFNIPQSSQTLTGRAADAIRVRLDVQARLYGYDPKGETFPTVARLDAPKSVSEKILAKVEGACYYQAWIIEKRRKCTCPDGSPCRKTVRDS